MLNFSYTDFSRFYKRKLRCSMVGCGQSAFIEAVNDVGYRGSLSVEWEDGRMDRVHGATESCAFVRKPDFAPNQAAFDAAFAKR